MSSPGAKCGTASTRTARPRTISAATDDGLLLLMASFEFLRDNSPAEVGACLRAWNVAEALRGATALALRPWALQNRPPPEKGMLERSECYEQRASIVHSFLGTELAANAGGRSHDRIRGIAVAVAMLQPRRTGPCASIDSPLRQRSRSAVGLRQAKADRRQLPAGARSSAIIRGSETACGSQGLRAYGPQERANAGRYAPWDTNRRLAHR